MKMYNSTNLAAALCALAAQVGLSAPACATERTINSAHVTSVTPYPNGSFFVTFDVNNSYCTNANDPKRHYVFVDAGTGMTVDGLKLLYSAALLALTTGRGVSAAFDDTTNSCALLRLRLY